MCKAHGGTYEGNLRVELAPREGALHTFCHVDACIQPLVQAINNAGIRTVNCCCGHGHRHGSVILEDGREILIMPTSEDARKVDHLWPDILGNKLEQKPGGEYGRHNPHC